ncbi:MAG: hypothetical protein PG981_000363 [Wolbachia endosymbiont of Ctenocephalides orientis wCori]|nr:MAG: hypothetical protein PG981_000363 [Wolbachia endosymbiont of Ctenocephalides orientis wCori]
MLKVNNYNIFQEVISSNNIQMLFQLLHYATVGDLFTLDERIQAVCITSNPNAFLALFIRESFIGFSYNNGDNYIDLLDKFFNNAKSFDSYSSFLQISIISGSIYQVIVSDNRIMVNKLWEYYSKLPEYNNKVPQIDFMFDYTRSIVQTLQGNNYVHTFEKFFNDAKNLGNDVTTIHKGMLITILYAAASADNKVEVIDLLEHISNLPEYVNKKQFIDSVLHHARSSMHTKFASMNPEITGPSGSQDTNTDPRKDDNFSDLEDDEPSQSKRMLLCLNNVTKRKIDTKSEKCEFSWEDIDQFNEEKEESRNPSKIEIDSEKFIDYIKDLPEEKLQV